MINDGEATEYVTAAFIYTAWADDYGDRPFRKIFGSEGDEDVPHRELPPRARISFPVELTVEDIAWMRAGFLAEAWLASGPHLQSAVEQLLDELLQRLS